MKFLDKEPAAIGGKVEPEQVSYGKMNPKVKAMWVHALNSGEYEQCYDEFKIQLMTDDILKVSFCTLGVLFDLYEKETGCNVDTMHLGPVWDWSGLPGHDSFLLYKSKYRYIVDLNDYARLSFKEIAKLIDEQY